MKDVINQTMVLGDVGPLYCRFLNPEVVLLQSPPPLEQGPFCDGRPQSFDSGYEHSLEHLEALHFILYSDPHQ